MNKKNTKDRKSEIKTFLFRVKLPSAHSLYQFKYNLEVKTFVVIRRETRNTDFLFTQHFFLFTKLLSQQGKKKKREKGSTKVKTRREKKKNITRTALAPAADEEEEQVG